MIETGIHNPNYGADRFGFRDLAGVHWSLGAPQLYEHALRSHEAHIAAHGPLVADTGVHTGRSPKDKFIVRDANTDPIVWWDNNSPMSVEHFYVLLADFLAYAKGKSLFAQDLHGAPTRPSASRRASSPNTPGNSLFIRNLLIPAGRRRDIATFAPSISTIVDLPSFKADPTAPRTRTSTSSPATSPARSSLIGGSSYAGEMRSRSSPTSTTSCPRSTSCRCIARPIPAKTATRRSSRPLRHRRATLSADPHRTPHRRRRDTCGKSGVFNFEGGCYAKAIKLSREAEPEIYSTTERFGTVMENVAPIPSCACPTSTTT